MAALLPSNNYCTPAIIYLAIAFITLISSIGTVSLYVIAIQVIFVILWAWFLNFLCDTGFATISWILVFFPFIIMLLMIFIAFESLYFSMLPNHMMMPNYSMQNEAVPNYSMQNNAVPNNAVPNNAMPDNINVNTINANSINANSINTNSINAMKTTYSPISL